MNTQLLSTVPTHLLARLSASFSTGCLTLADLTPKALMFQIADGVRLSEWEGYSNTIMAVLSEVSGTGVEIANAIDEVRASMSQAMLKRLGIAA